MLQADILRTLIQAPDLLVMPGIFDGFSARLVKQAGFISGGGLTVARHVPKALCVNMGFGIRPRATTPLIAPEQLQALGVAVVIYPRLLTACAIQLSDPWDLINLHLSRPYPPAQDFHLIA
jgi:2-methylisocitrate lyase-like PEP mutase family enzyme